jgi:hypothetical protein
MIFIELLTEPTATRSQLIHDLSGAGLRADRYHDCSRPRFAGLGTAMTYMALLYGPFFSSIPALFVNSRRLSFHPDQCFRLLRASRFRFQPPALQTNITRHRLFVKARFGRQNPSEPLAYFSRVQGIPSFLRGVETNSHTFAAS